MATTVSNEILRSTLTARRHGLSHWLLPSATLDAGDLWIARSIRLVGIAATAGILASLGQALLSGAADRWLPVAVLAGELLVLAVVLRLNRRGSPQAAARLLALSLPLLSAMLMITSGQGFRDVAVLMLPASLILCGLLLDRATLVAVTLLTLVCTAVVRAGEAQGLLATPPAAVHPMTDIADAAIILVVTSLGVGLVAGRLRDSHERLRRQEAALRASEALYRGLIDLAADAIVVGAPATGFVEANHRATELTGYSREDLLCSASLETLFSAAERARLPFRYDLADQGQIVVAERALTRKDGTCVPVEMSSRRMPDGKYQTILRDVSERHRAEAERVALEIRLQQSHKMEAVGRLAGGVAHDFNNLLTAITGSLALALRDVSPDARAHRWLMETDKAAWRAAALTHQLLAFSRQQVIAPRVVDLRSLVEGAGSMLARMIGEDVTLSTRLADEQCLVEVDRGQLEQVLLNLAANARDAMPDGGTLTIEVGRTSSGAVASSRPARGSFVVMAVSDTGQGMSQEVRARIFEPFFTTKSAGSGTGLGLAMAYGAVEQNGGFIEVASEPGRGATFRIFLPETRGEKGAVPVPRADAPRGTETVLLVEDEATVRDVTREQLESLGYRVLPCANAAEALVVAAAHAAPLHLLLTDVVMPGMNGRELAARLTQTRPDLRVLFTSGYGQDVISRHGVLEAEVLLLRKPFALPQLAGLVRTALAGS